MIKTEKGVVDAVQDWMRANGFVEVQAVEVGRQGIDIQGTHATTREHWLIEAKGGAHSGKDESNRAWQGVSGAFLTSVRWRFQPEKEGERFAIAVPGSIWFDRHIAAIEGALRLLGISIFRVSDDGRVTLVDNPAVAELDGGNRNQLESGSLTISGVQ